MIKNNKLHAVSMEPKIDTDGESDFATNNTGKTRQVVKPIFKSKYSLPYQPIQDMSDAAFIDSKTDADKHLRSLGLLPCWSVDDKQRERRILLNNFINDLYKKQARK
jgi:hypothetical protein